uniref:Inhibitor I9 domain-containing protein n=1 Tax=Heterorhabditis bacteriophora TaxID=37862 RepID=A0A1I7XSH5_HETBA
MYEYEYIVTVQLNLWDEDMKNKLIANNGSIAKIEVDKENTDVS